MADSFNDQPVGTAVLECPPPAQEPPKYWLEIELVGDDGKPIPGEEYLVILPDGKPVPGFLDEDGYARLDGLPAAGTCRIQFPKLDRDAWDKLETAAARRPGA